MSLHVGLVIKLTTDSTRVFLGGVIVLGFDAVLLCLVDAKLSLVRESCRAVLTLVPESAAQEHQFGATPIVLADRILWDGFQTATAGAMLGHHVSVEAHLQPETLLANCTLELES